MRGVYLLSTCEKVTCKKVKYLVSFHFKGGYLGQKISLVELLSDTKLERGSDYFLYIEVLAIKQEKLIGKIIRFKMID